MVSATLVKPKLQPYLLTAVDAVGYSLNILKSCDCFTVVAEEAFTKTYTVLVSLFAISGTSTYLSSGLARVTDPPVKLSSEAQYPVKVAPVLFEIR